MDCSLGVVFFFQTCTCEFLHLLCKANSIVWVNCVWLDFKSLLKKVLTQKYILKTIYLKHKFDHASYILHAFDIEAVVDLYIRHCFSETLKQLRGKSPLKTFNLDSQENRCIARACTAETLPHLKRRTQIMRRSWQNIFRKCYKFCN